MSTPMVHQPNASHGMYYSHGIQQNICGGRAHVLQFIDNATARNWSIWGPPSTDTTDSHGLMPLPRNFIQRLRLLRSIDVIYARIEDRIMWPHFSRFAIRPLKRCIGNPLVAWEFNTVPEYGRMCGLSEADQSRAINELRQCARDCDIAFCVSNKIAEYVASELKLHDVIVVPNGSDPERFRPDVAPVRYVLECGGALRVVWMGGGDIPWHDFDMLHDIATRCWQHDHGKTVQFFAISAVCPRLAEMPPNVRCVGCQPYADLPRWLSGMHVGLCLYRKGPADYSSPLKLFDYMASGLAVLSTPQPQVAEVLRAAGQSTSVLNGADEFADALLAYALNPDLAKRQGAVLRELLISRYTWRHAVGRILDEIDRRL